MALKAVQVLADPIPRESLVFLEFLVTADDLPAGEISDAGVEVAVVDADEPSSDLVEGDWETAAWQSGSSTLSGTAEILIGPAQDIVLTKAKHWAWVRVDTTVMAIGGSEIPVLGPFEITTV